MRECTGRTQVSCAVKQTTVNASLAVLSKILAGLGQLICCKHDSISNAYPTSVMLACVIKLLEWLVLVWWQIS